METEHGKLFVGGIPQETTEETLKDHFGEYGEVKESEIPRNRVTGNGRGFGFVTFFDPSVLNAALDKEHTILGRMVEVKEAKPKGERYRNQQCPYLQQTNNCDGNSTNPMSTKKIFVGGLPSSLTEEQFKNYFERFGATTDVVVIKEKENGRPRGFGFITFECEEVVNSVLQSKFYKLNCKDVEVKRAKPKDKSNKHICNYNCKNTGQGFDRLSVSVGNGLPPAYVPPCNFYSPGMLTYGGVPGYYDYPYGSGFLPYLSNGIAYVDTSNWNPLPDGTQVFYPRYSGGSINGWVSGPVDVTDGGGGYLGNATSAVNGGDFVNGWASGPVVVTAVNGSGSDQGSVAAAVNGSSNENESGGVTKLPAPTILQPALPQVDDASCPECNHAERQKEADC